MLTGATIGLERGGPVRATAFLRRTAEAEAADGGRTRSLGSGSLDESSAGCEEGLGVVRSLSGDQPSEGERSLVSASEMDENVDCELLRLWFTALLTVLAVEGGTGLPRVRGDGIARSRAVKAGEVRAAVFAGEG